MASTERVSLMQEQGSGLLDTGSKEMPVLLGLILHAAADGLAVGVACISPSVKLAAAVSMAMVLHKGPVAFGLGVFLVSQDLPTYRIVRVSLKPPRASSSHSLCLFGHQESLNWH